MSDDLVKLLRDEAQINANYDGIAYQLLTRTADRIEALEAEIARLQFERDGPAGHITLKVKAFYPRRLSEEEMQRLSDTGELP